MHNEHTNFTKNKICRLSIDCACERKIESSVCIHNSIAYLVLFSHHYRVESCMLRVCDSVLHCSRVIFFLFSFDSSVFAISWDSTNAYGYFNCIKLKLIHRCSVYFMICDFRSLTAFKDRPDNRLQQLHRYIIYHLKCSANQLKEEKKKNIHRSGCVHDVWMIYTYISFWMCLKAKVCKCSIEEDTIKSSHN